MKNSDSEYNKSAIKIEKLKKLFRKIFPLKVRKVIKKTFIFKIMRIILIINEASAYPDMKRKCRLSRFWDNFKWLLKYNNCCTAYNEFGLDIKNFRNQNDYMDIKNIKKQKQEAYVNNDSEDESMSLHKRNLEIKYQLLADNKFIFYSYLNTINKNITPEVLLVFNKENIIWQNNTNYKSIKDFVKESKDAKYICKSLVGLGGHSIYLFKVKNKKLLINNGSINLKDFLDIVGDESYMIQEYCYQHDKIAKLNSSSLNTMRIISTRFSKKVNILAGMIRIGVDKNSIVDNASSGGTFVGIDIEKGTLKKYGYYHKGIRQTAHPASGVEYEGYEIPYWKETIELIEKMHPYFYGLNSIGWDIAITEKGPVIIEVNWDWGTKGLQICNGGLKKKWEALKKK